MKNTIKQGECIIVSYSVLMSVYYKEKPNYLKDSIQSIVNQTIQTNDFVLVCDGELTTELNEIIANYEKAYPDIFNVIRLPENKGLGNALNVGLSNCKNSLVARMDSDDIAYLNRCELQLKCFENSNLDIVSAFVEEFSNDISNITAIRTVPENQSKILEFIKKRNPFNHPCVMYKKESVFNAGNYQDFYLHEDYYLWARMLKNGAVGYNIQTPLLYMRAGSEMYSRRGGYKYFVSSKKFQKYLFNNQIIDVRQYIINTIIRFFMQVAVPDFVRSYIYKILLR